MLTAHQPNYLPYPGFFQKIAAADAFLVVDTTQFVKRGPFGWIHRNRIRTANGSTWLSLPALTKGRYEQRICDVELNPRVNWGRKHWRTLELSYGKAPHWERLAPSLREIYEAQHRWLSPLNTDLIRWFMRQLDLEQEVVLASELAAEGKSTDYIIAFCRELGADRFLSGKHGRDYLELDRFDEAGVEVAFQSYTPPQYETAMGDSSGDFENLSMLDMLMWCGDDAIAWTHAVPEVESA